MILLFFVAFIVLSCGSGGGYETPVPNDPPKSDNELTFNADVKPILINFCDQCHSGATFLSSEEAFLSSKAPTRIANGSMPQRGSSNYSQFGEKQKTVIAKFVSENR
jgi:hypothetical protein